ncbi:efflux RND transporter periplasmic adaptor subunit [Verrucomicrobiales bacterium BCK34]|nr:efflux RND transporter periplasmic adaptor subunit [Verrucomicrobiales bacterium BCK34]
MKKTVITAAISVVAGLGLGALIFGGNTGHDHEPAGGAGKEAKAKAEVWTCSMHPQVKQPNPGKCPICAMDLIPLSAMGGGDGERSFSMSEAAKQLAGITTTEVVRDYPLAEIQLFGKIMYDETRMSTVAARFPARIDKLYVDYTGIRVKKGDHLATVYSPDLLSVQTELLTAKKFGNDNAAKITRDKLRLWGFSEERIQKIETSGKTSDQLTIDAPKSGIVTQMNVREGEYVETGTPYFKIAELDEVWVMLDAYESDTPWLRFGQNVQFTTESIPGNLFDGKISFIAPELNSTTRTVSVRVNVPNEDNLLKPGMFVSGLVEAKVAAAGKVLDPSLAGKWISPMHPEVVKDQPGQCDICGMDLVPAEELGYLASDAEGEPPLLVPVSAVLNTGKRSVVYVEQPDTEQPTFEGREILIGPRANDQYIVEAGLREGERVVAQGGFVIDSALQIQAKPSMMLPSEKGERLFPEAEAPKEFLTQSDKVLRAYFNLQGALAGDDLDKAKSAAKEGISQLSGMPVKTLPESSVEIWDEVAGRMKSSFQMIAETESIESTRAEFQKLTTISDELVRRFGTAHLPVYEHYCPMAFDDTGGTWLQPDENLLNPYFGSSMLNCGEVRDQLASAKSMPLNEAGTRALKSAVGDYLAIQAALAKDSLEESVASASTLAESAAVLGETVSGNPEAAFQLRNLSDQLKAISEKAAATDNLAQFRVNFKILSELTKSLVTSFGAELESSLYNAHCPMAFNNAGGDWLQTTEDIKNPYFGASMLGCGEITAQLAGKKKDSTETQEHSHSETPKKDTE